MNKYLRQLFTAVVALFVILGLSSTIIMAVRAMVRRWPSKSAPVVSSPW